MGFSKRFAAFAALGFALAAAAACSSAQSVVAADYDQSCTTDSECTLVAELKVNGSSCSESCPSGALNRRALEKFRADFAERQKECTSLGQPSCSVGGILSLCRASKCAAVDCTKESCPGADAGTD